MKMEYIEILMSLLVPIVAVALSFLVIDLFIDGIFVLGMPIFLMWWIPIHIIGFIIKAIQLNYKIIKRKK